MQKATPDFVTHGNGPNGPETLSDKAFCAVCILIIAATVLLFVVAAIGFLWTFLPWWAAILLGVLLGVASFFRVVVL